MQPIRPIAAAFAALLVATALTGCAAKKAEVPTTFATYTADDKNFTADSPRGWDVKGGASGATDSSVDYLSGDAKLTIDADAAGSFMADAMITPQSSSGDSSAPVLTPLDKLHAKQGSQMANNLDGYSEVTTQALQSAYGQGKITEYTAKGIHGYRATILGKERLVSVNAVCGEDEWASLSQPYARIISSIAPGPQ